MDISFANKDENIISRTHGYIVKVKTEQQDESVESQNKNLSHIKLEMLDSTDEHKKTISLQEINVENSDSTAMIKNSFHVLLSSDDVVLETEIQKSIVKKEFVDCLNKEHNNDLFPDANIETPVHQIKNESSREKLEEDLQELKELDSIQKMCFIETERNKYSGLFSCNDRSTEKEHLFIPMDLKIEPLENKDSKIPLRLQNTSTKAKENNLVQSTDNSNNVKEVQRYPVKKLVEDFESNKDNVDELLDDMKHNYKIENLDLSLKEETEDFKTPEEQIRRNEVITYQNGIEFKSVDGGRCFDPFGQCSSNNSFFNDNNNKHGFLNQAGSVSFECQLCVKKLRSKLALDGHIVTKHSENQQAMSTVTSKVHSCKMCEFKTVYNNYLTVHLTRHTGVENKKFQCHICGHRATQKGSLKIHIQNHAGLLSFPCQICNKKLKSKVNLDHHIVLRHSNVKTVMKNVTDKVLSCEICGYKTVTSSKLKGHIAYKHNRDEESKKEMFECDICGFKAAQKGYLRVHIEKHKGLKYLFCQICNKKLSSKYSLDNHIVAAHTNDEKAMNTVTSKVHSCEFCEYKTVKFRDFKTHVLKHRRGRKVKQFQCDFCKFKTNYKGYLKTHVQKHVERDQSFLLNTQ